MRMQEEEDITALFQRIDEVTNSIRGLKQELQEEDVV